MAALTAKHGTNAGLRGLEVSLCEASCRRN